MKTALSDISHGLHNANSMRRKLALQRHYIKSYFQIKAHYFTNIYLKFCAFIFVARARLCR